MGRSDKKFCSDPCRSLYFRTQNEQFLLSIRQIESILKRNRRILYRFWEKAGEAVVPAKRLQDAGFAPEFCTQVLSDQQGRNWQVVYDLGFRQSEDWVELMRLPESRPQEFTARS
jgi:hypothetical protein